jgi:hypothetical protein
MSKIFNIMIQNKLKGDKFNKQGKQRTAHKTPRTTVAHILYSPIRYRAEAPANNPSQHTKRRPMHQVDPLTQTPLSSRNAAATTPDLLTSPPATASARSMPRNATAGFP